MRRLFISDLHLQPERPDISRAFHYFLNQIVPACDELYLLGDIFEYWIGDDAPLPGLEPLFDQLQQLSSQGSRLFFMHGNRDFLVGEQLMHRIGATLLPAQHQLQLNGETALLLHGDELCTDDAEYQRFRAQVRQPQWQQAFLAKPVAERLAIARDLRAASREQGAMKQDTIMDVNPHAVAAAMNQAQADLLIHGHTHRPARHPDPRGNGHSERIVLGDWSESGWYLELSGAKRELIRFTPPEVFRPQCTGTPL